MKRLLLAWLCVPVFVVMGLLIAPPQSVSAAVDPACIKGGVLGIEPWYKYLDVGDKDGDPCAIKGPANPHDGGLAWDAAVPRILLAVVEILLRIAGLVAVVFTIYGGFQYIISQGEPDATKKAKGTIVGASVGVVIAIFATVIVGFIGRILWF